MDPQAVAQDLQRSRERLRSVMVPDEREATGHGDVFPRSATMRFLLDGQRRGTATMLLGGLFSLVLGRRLKKGRRSRKPQGKARSLAGTLMTLLGNAGRR